MSSNPPPAHLDVDVLPAPGPDGPHCVWQINQEGDDEQVCVWVETEGSDGIMPWACARRIDGFRWAAGMIVNQIAMKASITGCGCTIGAQCVFDTFDDDEPRRVVLTKTATMAGFGPEVPGE